VTMKAIFLDRDGVLNLPILREDGYGPPSGVKDLIIPGDVKPALERLKAAWFRLIVVTNQPDIARDRTTMLQVVKIHQALLLTLPMIDSIQVCPHDNEDDCDCRKPKPGMLTFAAEHYQIDLPQSYMIGDRGTDMEAGYNAGCRTILLRRNSAPDDPSLDVWEELADACVSNLTEAANLIIKHEEKSNVEPPTREPGH